MCGEYRSRQPDSATTQHTFEGVPMADPLAGWHLLTADHDNNTGGSRLAVTEILGDNALSVDAVKTCG